MLETLSQYSGTLAASFLTGKTPDADSPTPALTNVVGKRFVAISETVEGARINEQLFKALSGQDRLVYRPMHQEAIEFEPTFKLFMVCNDLPEFKGSDYAMKRRIRVIPFESSFKAEIKAPDHDHNHYPLDKTLSQKVSQWKHAMMGLLLQGYKLYLAEGLNPSALIKDATNRYQQENDKYAKFLEECLIKKEGGFLKVMDVGSQFIVWSRRAFGDSSAKSSDPRKYTPYITMALLKEPWLIQKQKREDFVVFVGIDIRQ
jgi:putative DNA primase/helicase